jgi:hypothetical protein
MKRFVPIVAILMTTASQLNAQSPACPIPASDGRILFPDGSMAMRTRLAVNPDGAAASYTPGDHGYTYIANGVNLRDGNGFISCSAAGNAGRCRREWIRAENMGFATGSPQFCSFAIEVEPMTPGASRTSCGSGRFVVGGGKGRPKLGPPIAAVAGGTIRPYLSMTSLRHRVGGELRYIDSASIPAIVVPTTRPDLVGAIVWVRYNDRATFAIAGDTGPRFGEGSVALHQGLRSGNAGPAQAVGPIPLALRCGSAESSLRAPFESRPDIAGDRCRPGQSARGASDIRAYAGIDASAVETVILRVKPPMQGSTVTAEVTLAALEQWATAAGFSRTRLAGMADCLAD